MNFFGKNTRKPKKAPSTNSSRDDSESSSRSPSPTKQPARDREEFRKSVPPPASSSRSSFSRPDLSSRYTFDIRSHPLNLPPEQLKRLSALSRMSDPVPMEVDDHSTAAPPSSPPPSQSGVPASEEPAVRTKLFEFFIFFFLFGFFPPYQPFLLTQLSAGCEWRQWNAEWRSYSSST